MNIGHPLTTKVNATNCSLCILHKSHFNLLPNTEFRRQREQNNMCNVRQNERENKKTREEFKEQKVYNSWPYGSRIQKRIWITEACAMHFYGMA